MEKRYQVFVSSTYEDLKEERKAVIENLLNAKYIPTGMEMFSASNDEQFNYIKKILDDCDYYVLIVGGRYGSINTSTGKSYTEQEFDYAISKGIPVLTFLHSKPKNLPEEKREDDKQAELEAFRKKASNNRLCKMWRSTIDLASSVIISLTEEVSNNPQLGWTRGGEFDDAELLAQINDLRIQKEQLERKVIDLESVEPLKSLAFDKDTFRIRGKFYHNRYVDVDIELTWNNIFSIIAPYLFSPNAFPVFKSNFLTGLNAEHSISWTSINENCLQTIKIQLLALKLIQVEQGTMKGGGQSEFIKLTEKGKRYLLEIKSIRK